MTDAGLRVVADAGLRVQAVRVARGSSWAQTGCSSWAQDASEAAGVPSRSIKATACECCCWPGRPGTGGISSASQSPAVWDLIQAAKAAELVLPAVVAADLSDAEVIARAVTSFARELGLPEKTVEIYGGSASGRRRVLDLHAAALVAVPAGAGAGMVRVDIRTVLGELLRHEQHFWYHSAHEPPDCPTARTGCHR